MKSNRKFWTPAVLSAGTVIGAALLWSSASPPASAVVSTLASAAASTVSGSVTGSPETVSFSGLVSINSTRVSDPDFFRPDVVILSVDLSGMKGKGMSTGKVYVVSNQEIITRTLVAGENIVLTFPFVPNGTSNVTMSPRIGAATLGVSFDVSTGALTGATVTVSNP
jgi:hypothetical protein